MHFQKPPFEINKIFLFKSSHYPFQSSEKSAAFLMGISCIEAGEKQICIKTYQIFCCHSVSCSLCLTSSWDYICSPYTNVILRNTLLSAIMCYFSCLHNDQFSFLCNTSCQFSISIEKSLVRFFLLFLRF